MNIYVKQRLKQIDMFRFIDNNIFKDVVWLHRYIHMYTEYFTTIFVSTPTLTGAF